MRKFLTDIIGTMYAADGGMSLFRLTFFISFFVLIGISIGDLCSVTHTFNHYIELCGFVAGLGGLACGNKLVDIKGANSHE